MYAKLKAKDGQVSLRPNKSFADLHPLVVKKGKPHEFETFADYTKFSESIEILGAMKVIEVELVPDKLQEKEPEEKAGDAETIEEPVEAPVAEPAAKTKPSEKPSKGSKPSEKKKKKPAEELKKSEEELLEDIKAKI